MPDFSSFRPAPKTRRTPNLYAPQQPQGYSDREVDMWNAQRGMAVMQENIARAGGGTPTTRRTGSSSTSQPGVISAGEKVTRVQRGDGSIIPVAAVTGDSHLIRPKGSANIYVSPSTGERFKPDPASPMGLSSIGTARAEALAKQAEKDAKLAAKQAVADDKEAIRQENDRREAAFAAEGRPSYTDAHGRIQPKQSDEAWEATKKQKQAGKQKANEYLKDGRRFYTDKITGQPVPMTSDEEHARNKAEKMAKIQKDAAERPHKQRLDVLKAELSNPDLKVSDKDLKDADEALTAASAPLMALRGNDDFVTPISDDEVKAMLKDADPAKKAAANAYLNARENVGKLAKAEAQRKALEQEVYKTNLRIADPDKYAEELKAEAPAKSAEDLKAHATEIEERIKARAAEHKAETDRIKAKDDELSAQHALTKKRYDEALAKGEAPAVIGTLGDSLNDLEEQMTQWESESQDQRAAVNAQAQEINNDAANLKILGDEEKRRADEQQQKHVEQLDAALPGAGKRYGDTVADVKKRAQDLRDKYPDPSAPEAKAAFEALQKDFKEKVGAITKEAEAEATKQAEAGKALYDEFGKDYQADWSDPEASDNVTSMMLVAAEKHGLTEKQARYWLSTYAQSDWDRPSAVGKGSSPLKHTAGEDAEQEYRVLPNGNITVNPGSLLDKEEYERVVKSAPVSREAKEQALKVRQQIAPELAEKSIATLRSNDKMAEWLDKNTSGTDLERMEQFTAKMKAGGWTTAAMYRFASSLANMGASWTGAAAAATGSDTFTQASVPSLLSSSWWKKRAEQFDTAAGTAEKGTNLLGKYAAMAVGGIPSVAESMVAGNVAGGVLKGAAALKGAYRLAKAGVQLKKGLDYTSIAAKAGGLSDTALQTAGVSGAALDAAIQQGGSTYVDAYDKYLKDEAGKLAFDADGGNIPKAEIEAAKGRARMMALKPAILDAAQTAALTALGGAKGTEAIFRKGGKEALKEGVKKSFGKKLGELGLDIGEEALEEYSNQFVSGVIAQATYEPEKTIKQIFEQAFDAGIVGGVLGGLGGGMKQFGEYREGKNKASDQPPAPDIGPAPTPSILPEQAAANAAAIDNWTPTGALPSSIQDAAKAAHGKAPTPEQHADTARTAAHALVEIAAGQDPRTMSPEVRRALGIKINTNTGAIEPLSKNVTPLVDSVPDEKGNHQPVITDAARAWLAQEVPSAGEAVKLSYSERVAQIQNPPKPAKKPKAAKVDRKVDKTATETAPAVEETPIAKPDTKGESLPTSDVGVGPETALPPTAESTPKSATIAPSEQEDTTIAAETDASLQARTAGPDRTAYTQAISDRRAAAERLVLTIKKGDKIVLSDGEEMVAEKDAIQKTGEVQFVGNSTPVAAAPFLMRDRATLPSGEVVELPAGKIVRAKDSGSQQKPQPAEQEKAPRGTSKPDTRKVEAQGLAGGELIAKAEKDAQKVVDFIIPTNGSGERTRAAAAKDAIIAALRRYNGHLPIDLAKGDIGFSYQGGKVLVDVARAVKEIARDATSPEMAREMAQKLFDHEIIHFFAVNTVGNERIMGVWDALPADVRKAVQDAYSVRLVATGAPALELNEFSGGHEYFRAMVEATRTGVLSEQVLGTELAAKWKQYLSDVLAFLRDLSRQFASIKSDAKRKELMGKVDAIRKEITDALDQFEKSITLESNSPGNEPAQAASTGAVSTTGTSSESPVEGSPNTVAAADVAGSITNEKPSSSKNEREDGLAAPTLADNDHYLFHSKPGDIAATPDGGNIFIVGHFTKQKDANAVKAQFDSVRPGTAKVTPWLAKPKREGGKTVSMWAVTIANVSQSFADQITSMRQENGLGKTTAERQVDQTVTDNSVTDHPQQAIIKGDTITIRMKVDKQIMAAYSFPLAEWLAAEKGPSANPNWNRREIIKKHTEKFKLDDQDGGPSQADRIRDAQGYAIQKALAAHAKATEVSNDTKSPAISPPEIKEAAPSLKSEEPAAPKSGASKKSLDKIKGAFDSLNANPAPESKAQIGLPKDRRAAFLDVAESLIADGVNTPEGLAAALTEARPDGSLQKYSQALWNFFGTIDPDLTGQHDWSAIYAPVDNPASDATITNESDMVQRPGSAESGDAGSTGGTITEGSADSGRVGSDESSTPTQDGEGENAAAESAGGAEPTSAGPGTSGSGRDDASIGPRDSGDVRSEHATVNYSITDADKIGEGGLKTKYADNVAAIKLVKELQAAGRKPTAAEQKILVRYVGWGGLKGVFDPTNKTWKDQHAEIKGLLTEDEYAAAKRSRLDAHFTSPTVIKNGIWGALRRFGFTGGKMLEGGVGIGHMIGLMPASVRPASSYLGIEKDPITAQIAAYLYPEASIHNAGFEKATVERDHFDAAAGNPPFGQQQLYDPLFKAASKFSIHNYFIAKHIEALRPGGVGAWVVSHNFLDALDPAAREYIASKAEFLGAIRLPNTAFKGNANTEVTTDIVYFRRVADGTETNTDWTKATKQSDKDGNAYSLNEWINNHRDMILGTLDTTGSMYGPGELTVTAPPAQDLAQDIAAAVENLPADVYDNGTRDANIRLATPEYIPVPNEVRVGAYFIGEKGELRRRLSDANMERRSAPADVAEGTAERIRGMVEVRDAFNKVVSAELDNNATPAALDSLRAELNRIYDTFVKKHGLLHQTGNRRAFFSDPHAARILGLESDYDSGVSAATAKKNSVPVRKPTAKKADIFNRRVNSPYSEITKVETSKEALTVALNQRGTVDLDYMTQLSGIDRDTLLRELDGLIFETPQGEWQVASQYLSGNVRKKFHDAEAAAQNDPRFAANVEALKAVQPPDLEATQVTVTPGAPWVVSDVLKQFAKDLTGEDATSAVYNSANGGWIFNHPSNGTNSTQVWGTPKADFGTLFANILNNKPTIIHLPRGKDDPLVVDAHSTALAQAKSDAIREKWATWVWEDQARRESLLRIYNDKYNVYVDPKYDGSHLTLPGISNVVTLRPHQKDVVWRIMTDLTTLLDHVVGAGKTFAGVAAFMELRRLGRVRKPMFAVPNHLVTQWRDDFVKLYPNANVLFARPSDFKKDKRQQLFAKIMTGEYDAVIVGHSSLKKIGMSPQVEGELLREMLKEITDTLAAVAEAEGKRGSRAQTQLERQKEALEAKLARLADIGGADEVATFEELGIDGLFVDEAHEFKNLFYTTQMQNVAGLGNPAGSGKAFDLYLKTRHLRKRYGGKAPVVFATGTPISNSLVEMFTMQRYLQPEVLESMGITTLDAWAKVFATVKQVYEVNPTGTGMRLATRLAQFQNVGDLSAVYRTVADVITMSDLHAQAEAQGKKFPIPKVKGGKPKIYAVDRTPEQESYFGVETQRTTASGEPIYDGEGNPIFEYPEGSINWRVDNMPDDPREDNMLKLTSDARKAALDMRLVNPDAADRPESKINTTVRNILATAKEWDAEKGTQLVFCDLSVPSSARGKAKAKAVEAISAISWVRFHDKIVRVENVTPVTIPGFEEFEFFVRKDGKEWSVNERSSGVRVSSGSSKAKAVANAASRVTPMGVDKFRTAIESHKPSTEDLAAFFASQEEAPAKEADTEEADVADDTETTVSMDELLAEESSFSVYDDLKAKLIAGGLLPNQVEFIHDHDSPEKKSILFARMNKGDVRVLIGSTPKLGAGTNVQRKLVALHHMDAPWRPSDLEQREGRIIRQGNEFYEADPEGFEVSINRYATKMTYDTRMWQIIEHKAAGIEGFRRAERTTRVLEDVSGEAANAAEMKAASSGDPRIAREIMLRGEIMKLQNLFDGWRQNRWRTESRVNALGDHQNTHASLKKNRLELIAKRDAATTEEFSYQLPGGNKVDKKADILAPIAEIIKAAPDGERIAIGRYRGFMFAVTRRKTRGGDYYFEIEAAPIGANSTQYRGVSYLYKSDDLSATGLIQRFDNYLSGFEGDITRDAEGVIRSLKERDELQATLKDTFKDEAKLEEMKAEHATLRAELMQSRGKRAAAPAPDEALKAPPAGRYEPTTRAAIGQTIRRFEQAWKPFFTYSDDTAPKEKRKAALRKIIDQFATPENSTLWKQFAELPTEGLVPEDAERVAEAKELLPYLEGLALGAPPSGYKTPDSMLAATKATMQGMNKPAAPAFQSKDLHAAYQRAIRGTSTSSASIRSVFDAAKKDQPSLSADEFKAQVKADYYNGLVSLEPSEQSASVEKAGQFTMRDSLGVVHTNMVFMPTTEAEAMDAAERDVTSTPDQILSEWAGTGEALGQNPAPYPPIDSASEGDTPTTESNRANPGNTPLNRRDAANDRATYEAEEMTQVRFDDIRERVHEALEDDEQGNLDDILYKIADIEANGGGLSIEDQEKVRQLANRLSTRGRLDGDRPMMALASKLRIENAKIGSELGRGMGLRRDQYKTPQERLDDAIGNILAPSQDLIKERTIKAWQPSKKRSEIARLEAEIEEVKDQRAKDRLERELAETKARKDKDEEIAQIIEENNTKVDKVLARLGLTQADLSMTPDDRHSLQVGIMDSSTVKAHMVNLSPEVQKAIEMSVRGYADAAIVRDTGLSNDVVGRVTEHFRNEVAKKAVSQMVKVGKHTMGSIIEGGKNFLKWILGAPPAPLQGMVNAGVKNAANVQAQVQAILNAAIPTRRNRNRRALHAAVVNGKKGQKITVFVPYDPTDWQQVYRVARELSTREATAMSKVYEYWINGILSGPQTHVVNTASNVLSTLWHYLPQFFASATVNSVIRDPNSTQWGEWPRVWAGFLKGIAPALKNFALAWRTEADPIEYQYLDRPVTVMFNDAAMEKAGGGRSPAIGGPVGRVIRIPGRFLVAMDAFAKTLIMHGEVSAQAYRLGKKRGLSGVALENFMASQIAVHGSESWEGALQTAKELTFQDENDITKTVEKLANAAKQAKYVGLLAKFLFPFIRTPTNIYRAGMRKAGGSAGILLWKLGQAGFYKMKEGRPFFDTYAKGKMVQDVSESVMAGILWFGLMAISEGDPEDEDRWITMTGTRPYGIANAGERTAQLEGEGGSNLIIIRKNPVTGAKLDKPIRIAYGRYEPLALTMGSIIDAAREFKEWTRLPAGEQNTGVLAGNIMAHLASQAQDKTFVQGVASIMDVLDKLRAKRLEPGQEVAKFLINGAIPNLIRQPLRMSGREILDSHKANEILGSANIGNALADGEAKITTAGKPVTRAGNQYLNVLFPGTTEPGKATFYAALKDWNTRHPGEKWNPDPITKGDWYIYDPAKGGTKGKFPLKDVRQISLFEKMVGNLFASKSAIALGKLGYRPGIKATPDMIDAIKKSHTDAIKQVRSMPPSAFIVKAKP